ncbi:B-box type zinc finger protein ncl-1-like [Ischnura elegans]|uniref:B-box type zinc finger protein ncl-1-like n=1 Tax=Ischnura elegans TaxID=197161 RepID=UPI001ED866D2|nr:B-box type zinc finger protein ncl-1-like [Ischnura elegans]
MASSDETELFGEGFKGRSPCPLEESSPAEQEYVCNLCSNKYTEPRVLSCLHVYCEACLEKLVVNEAGDSGGRNTVIKCPDCKQETKVGARGISSLPSDHVAANILDMAAIESTAVLCTSCKTKEKAVARCSDCAHFLCPNCNSAHQFMRCFENHQVVAFEELKKSGEAVPIHKPIFCVTHPSENVQYYCEPCQVLMCKECVVEHSGSSHDWERASEVEGRLREELVSLMAQSKAQVGLCEEASTLLENALGELQLQHDNARAFIQETFQSYKAILEKCRDKVLNDLESLHSKRELKIMDTFHNVEKTMDKIEDACKFTSRLLEHGNSVEILSLKGVVGAQLKNLINNTPKPDVNVSLEFETDMKKFEAAAKATFGNLKREVPGTPKGVSPPPSLSDQQSPPNPSPASLPTSTQSSFEGEPPFPPITSQPQPPPLAPPLPPPPASALPPPPSTAPLSTPPPPPAGPLSPPGTAPPPPLQLTSIQEYNLQQLASLAAESVQREQVAAARAVARSSVPPVQPPTAPSSNPSPTPSSFSLADLLSGDLNSTNAINNLHALAKLGSVSLGTPDVANGALNGGPARAALALGRVSPPTLDSGPSALLANAHSSMSPLNGATFQPISSSTSPILSQPDEILGDGSSVGQGVAGAGGSSTGSGGAYPQPRSATTKLAPMQIRCKFGQLGPGKGQFNSPHGFCLGIEEDIIVADTNNHRIQVFEKTGTFKFQFGIPGKEEGQLWYPRKVAVMRNSGKFVVCDRGNERSRMQIFTKNGHFIKKIAIRYIDIVAGLAVTTQGHIVAVDSVSPTVFVISESGDLVRWLDCSDFMREPSDIAISGKEYFVCDFKGHCVVVFNEEGRFLRRIGCENITNFPNGIDISDAGDVLVGDSHGNRFHVAVFSRVGSLLSEFECPYVKVSRCCGLKITSEGYVVTLAKNNHHVLVLNTLYIV